jgi:HEAT repeat protein
MAMTKRRRRLLGALAVLAVLGTLGIPAVHWRLYGWIRREPFYQGRPASYFAAEIKRFFVAPGEGRPASSAEEWGRVHLPPRVAYALWGDVLPPFDIGGWKISGMEVVMIHYPPAPDPDSLPVLLALAGDSDARVQWCAAACLLHFEGKGVEPAVPSLMRMLDSPDPNVRYAAAWTLGSAGAAARPAVPRLRELLSDTTYVDLRTRVADAATEALLGIDPDSVPPAMRPER